MAVEKISHNKFASPHAGVTVETIAFTTREYEAGRMTRDEKIRLDNLAIRANSLSFLNGIETKADEVPDEWQKYIRNDSMSPR